MLFSSLTMVVSTKPYVFRLQISLCSSHGTGRYLALALLNISVEDMVCAPYIDCSLNFEE